MGTRTEPESLRRHAHGVAKGTDDASARAITAVLCSEAVDAGGDIVLAAAVDWSRFRQNPKMLRNHDHHDDIGTWAAESLTLTTIGGAPAWTARGRLYPPQVSPSADDVWQRLQAGSMGVSIGFLVGISTPRPGGRGSVYRQIEVLEASLVNIPACPHCVVIDKALHSPAPAAAMTRGALEALIREQIVRAVDAAMPRVEKHLSAALRRYTGRVD